MSKDKVYFIGDNMGKYYVNKKANIPTSARDFLIDNTFRKKDDRWYGSLLVKRIQDDEFEDIFDGKVLPHNIIQRMRSYKTAKRAQSFINKIINKAEYHIDHYQKYVDSYKAYKWSSPEATTESQYRAWINKNLQWVKDNLVVREAFVDQKFSIAFQRPETTKFIKGKASNQFCHRCGMCIKGFQHFHVSRSMNNVNLCCFCIVELGKEAEQNLEQLGTVQIEAINKQRFIQKLTQL